jgi:hypothetical protein
MCWPSRSACDVVVYSASVLAFLMEPVQISNEHRLTRPLAPLHSITSSARASRVGVTSMPRALTKRPGCAVLGADGAVVSRRFGFGHEKTS